MATLQTTSITGSLSATGELFTASNLAKTHAGNVEAYYQLSKRLQAFNHLGSTTVLEIEAITLAGGYSGQVERTTWRLQSRGQLNVTRHDENGGASYVTLKILNDTTVSDANGQNAKYAVGLICGTGSNYRMAYLRARFVEYDSTSRWVTIAQMATATPTTVSGSAMTYSSGWIANTNFTDTSFTEVIVLEKASQLTLTATTGTAPLVVSSTTLVSNLNSEYLNGQLASYYLTAGNLTGTLPSAVLGNSSFYLGTTQIALNRASANIALTGITSIDGNAATATNVAWSGITSKPTTLSGFGITDALDTSGTSQTKSGALTINGNLNAAGGLGVSGGISVSSSTYNIFNKPAVTNYQTVALFGAASTGLFLTDNSPIISTGTYYNNGWITTATSGTLLSFHGAAFNFQTFSGATVPNAPALSSRFNISATLSRSYVNFQTDGNLIALGTAAITGAITQNGNQVLHAGNYSSYALPLTGGTVSGAISAGTTITAPEYIVTQGVSTGPSTGDYSGPRSLNELAFVLSTVVNAPDPLRCRTVLDAQVLTSGVWSTDTTTFWNGLLGGATVASLISAAEYAAGVTAKRATIDTGGGYRRPNIIFVQRGWDQNNYACTILLESSANNSTWTTIGTATLTTNSSGLATFAQNDFGSARYFRFTVTATVAITSGGLRISNITSLTTNPSAYGAFIRHLIPTSTSTALTIPGALTCSSTASVASTLTVSGTIISSNTSTSGTIQFGTDTSLISLYRDNTYDLVLHQGFSSSYGLYLGSAGSVYVNLDTNNNDTDKVFAVTSGSLKGGTELFRVQENGNVGIGTTNPATLLQINTGTPTSATGGLQFGDDTYSRIYRDGSSRVRTSSHFASGGYIQTLNNEIYSSAYSATLNINCGNSAQNGWISGIALSPGGNVRIPGGIVNSGLSAQWTVSGGGTATFNGSAILWSQRVIAIPVEKTEFSTQGYIDINCPTSGTVTYYNSSDVTTTVTCTANGIPLGQWEALYYEVTPGQGNSSDQTKFRVVNFVNSTWRPSSNWLLLAIRTTDVEVLKWIPGQANIKSGGKYDFSRVTEYFYANDYYLNGATSTFIRSDGVFNFLTNAGGAQTGKFANIQVSSTYSGTLPTDGILFGTDSNLYRTSADTLKTDDSLIINSKCSVATSISATYTVDINGSLHYTSASASSDVRFKKNIEPINDALIKLNNVRGVKFEWNEFVNARRNGYELNKPTLGVIAQELEAVFPELVDHWHLSDDCPDARAVNYEKIIPVLIEAVKELNNKNIQLEARLSALESKLQ